MHSKSVRGGTLGRAAALALCIVLLLFAMFLTYNRLFFGDRDDLCGGYDVYRAAGPLSYFMDASVHRQGELPLWNPLTLCGMPYAANPVTAFYYPPNLLRSFLSFNPTPFKTQVGWIILMGSHLLLAGVGIVCLARSHRLSYPGALTAALVFMFSAIWIRRVCEYHFINMVAWLPFLLLITRHALLAGSMRRKLFLALGAGLIFGVSLLAGTMNVAPYMGVTIAAYALLHRFILNPAAPEKGASLGKAFAGDAAFLVVLFVVASLIAAALVLPGMELSEHSARGKDAVQKLAEPHYGETWGEFYREMIRFPGMKFKHESIRGAGIAALVLAFGGLMSRRGREPALFGLLFLVLFDCSMGAPWPISTVLYRISPLQMIASTRAFDFALLPMGMLAGLGVDGVTTREQPKLWRALRMVVLVGAGALFLYSLNKLVGPGTFLAPGREVLIIPGAAVVVLALGHWLPPKHLWQGLLVVLVFGETLAWNLDYVPSIITKRNFAQWAGVYEGEEPFWSDNRRGVDHIQNRHLYELRGVMHGYEPVHIADARDVLESDGRGRRYQRSVKAYEVTQENNRGNLFLKRQFWLARQYVRGPLRNKHSLFPAATTVYLPKAENLPIPEVAEQDLPRVAVSDQAQEVRFFTDTQVAQFARNLDRRGTRRTIRLPVIGMPDLHSVLCLRFRNDATVTVKSEFRDVDTGRTQAGKRARIAARRTSAIIFQLPLPDFERLQPTITVEFASPEAKLHLQDIYLLADHADEGGLLKVQERKANSVTVQVHDLPDYRVLTNLDAAYPGWKAYLDGERVPILLADDAFKAVVVPPGTHTVRFVYAPGRVYLGASITGLTTLAALAGILLLRRKKEAPA